MSNLNQGFSTGIQGAQMGGQVGGVWGAIIGGVAGFAIGNDTPDYEKIAREKYNNEVVKNTATALFDLKRQQNVENIRTAQALIAYQDERRVGTSQYNAAFGANDIIGSSAEALQQVLDFQTTQAEAQVWHDYTVGIDNYNTNVDAIVNRGISGLRRTKGSTTQMDFGALTAQGLELYGQYGGKISSAFNSWRSGVTTNTGFSGLSGLGDFGRGTGNGGNVSSFTGGGMASLSA